MIQVKHDIDMGGVSVCIGVPCSLSIHPLVVRSLFQAQTACFDMGIPCSLALIAGNSVVQWARDEVVHLFLSSPSNKLFMLDSDIVFDPETFMRMIALSQVRDVVCAAYTAKKDPPTFYIYHDTTKPLVVDEYGLVEIWGTGLGFTVINRHVIESLANSTPKVYDEISSKEYASIFKIGVFDGKRRGEDMAFFQSIRDLGHKVYLDPSVELGHVGTKVYKGKAIDAFTQHKT